MYKKAISHFKRVDPVLYSASFRIESFSLQTSNDFFYSLSRDIINQQLNGKVADIILNRFVNLFENQVLEYKQLLKIKDEEIRKTGVSWAKIKYLKDLAEKIKNCEINFEIMPNLNDRDVIKELVKVKGIGRWTAEMFLMFSLGRPDVFSCGDLGLKVAVQKLYGLKERPDIQILQNLSKRWSPYRTYASMILWRTLKV